MELDLDCDNLLSLQAGAPSQFLRDSYEYTDETICPYNRPAGASHDDCWSGLVVDTCNLPYDFNSIMHYHLRAFAVDSSKNTMTP